MGYLIFLGIVIISFGLLRKFGIKTPIKKVMKTIEISESERLQRIKEEKIEFEKYKLEEEKREEEEFFSNWREELIGKPKSQKYKKFRDNKLIKLKLKEQEKTQKYYKNFKKRF